MLGRTRDVDQLLHENPDLIHTTGAHGIPLLTHAAFSGNIALIQLLSQYGAHTGFSAALHNAVSKGHEAMARWCLENGQPDLGWKNFEGQTVLTVAKQRQSETIIQLLQAWGATE
jgi:ankyrin repeat protein